MLNRLPCGSGNVWIWVCLLVLLAGGCASTPPKLIPPVTLSINNGPAAVGEYPPGEIHALVLSNEQLKLTFGKDVNGDFSGTSVMKNGRELAHNLKGFEAHDVDRGRTFYLDYGGGKGRLEADSIRIIKNTPEMCHFAVIDAHNATRLEHHFVMMQNQSGVYGYVVIRTEPGQGGGEMRTMYRFDRNILDHAWNMERQGQQPKYEALVKMKAMQDETWELADGTIYQKYDYAAYMGESGMWGHYGNGFGVWFMPVSKESYSGGPLRQQLTVHQDALILNHIGGGHFGSGGTAAGNAGEKIHGPWYLYFNTGATGGEMLSDAMKVAVAEEKKLPYKWVEEPLYPTKRSTVSGQLKITDGRAGAGGAWVVLAEPGRDVYGQSGDYIFYSRSDKDGKFTIPNVRPGIYALRAWVNEGSITQELIRDYIEVDDEKVDLGMVEWSPPKRSHFLWQVGKSDRMASEFRFGRELRNLKWIGRVPENLTYTIGLSKADQDWYFAQGKVGDWDINFYSARTYPGNAHLTVALAGGGACSVTVLVNDHEVKTITPANDASTYRSALRGARYGLYAITFPAEYLRVGQNTVRFRMTNAGNRWNGIMYDTIVMEVE